MSTAKDLLVIDASEVSYCPDPNDPHNPPRDVRDIREAMHPVSNPLDDLPPFKPPVRLLGGDVAGSSCRLTQPHVATLPDGTRVNLPAGTVLREGHDDMVDDAADQFFDDVCKLIPWEKPDVPERREALRIVGEKIAKADRCECPDFSCSPHYTEEGSR